MGYISKQTIQGTYTIKTSGSTLGPYSSLWSEYKLDNHWGVNFNMVLSGGLLKKLTVKDGSKSEVIDLPKGEYEGLHNFRLSLGFRYYF